MNRQKMIFSVIDEQTIKSQEFNQICLLEEVKITTAKDPIQHITGFSMSKAHLVQV